MHQKQTTYQDQPHSKVSQREFSDNFIKFFVHSMVPLRAIEDRYFKKANENAGIRQNGLSLMSRRSLGRLTQEYYNLEINVIKSMLKLYCMYAPLQI